MLDKKIVIIAGPTAVGKTKYAIEIAKKLNGEIISADSMQLYKYMDIGSAKPSLDELREVRHYLIGDIDPKEEFSAAKYHKLASRAINAAYKRGKLPIISGGTGLYINSLIYNMDFSASPLGSEYRKRLEQETDKFGKEHLHKILEDRAPDVAAGIHPNNLRKVIRALEVLESSGKEIKPFAELNDKNKEYDSILIGLDRDREELYDRINKRVDVLVATGLLEEVEGLLKMGLSEDNISMKGIGYKELIGHINGEYDLERAIYLIKRNSRHYAKRQLTWFKRYEEIKWFNLSNYKDDEDGIAEILKWLKSKNL